MGNELAEGQNTGIGTGRGCYLESAASYRPVEAGTAAQRGTGLLGLVELLFHQLGPVGLL